MAMTTKYKTFAVLLSSAFAVAGGIAVGQSASDGSIETARAAVAQSIPEANPEQQVALALQAANGNIPVAVAALLANNVPLTSVVPSLLQAGVLPSGIASAAIVAGALPTDVADAVVKSAPSAAPQVVATISNLITGNTAVGQMTPVSSSQAQTINAVVAAAFNALPQAQSAAILTSIVQVVSSSVPNAASAVVQAAVTLLPSAAPQFVSAAVTGVASVAGATPQTTQIIAQVVSVATSANNALASQIAVVAIISAPFSSVAVVQASLAAAPAASAVQVVASALAAAQLAGVPVAAITQSASAAGVSASAINQAVVQSSSTAAQQIAGAGQALAISSKADQQSNQLLAQQSMQQMSLLSTQTALLANAPQQITPAPGAGPGGVTDPSLSQPVTTTADPTASGVNSPS